jgi:hypothetical protein
MQTPEPEGTFGFRPLVGNEKPQSNEIEVTEAHKSYIESLEDKERIQLWQNLTSKNKSAKKRALRKIAHASRMRNKK